MPSVAFAFVGWFFVSVVVIIVLALYGLLHLLSKLGK